MRQFFQRADIFLLVMSVICASYGLVLVSRATASMGSSKFIIVQAFSLFLGLIAFVVLTVLDADILGEQWKWLCVINVALLVALVIFGQDDGTGNKSWIRFAGIGIQPSEVIKVLYIVISAKQMTYLKEYKDINSFMSVVQMAGHFAIVFGMIVVVSSDLGSASILLGIFLIMFFALGARLYWFALGGAAVAALIPVIWSYLLKPYQRNRLLAPYDKTIDPDGWGITWQTTQSRISLANGRLSGVEAGYTPNVFTGKHTDFIFATAGEQFGMIGAIILIVLLMIIIVHCVRVGLNSGRTYDMLICVGVAASLAFQTFINIGMCLGITPVIGILCDALMLAVSFFPQTWNVGTSVTVFNRALVYRRVRDLFADIRLSTAVMFTAIAVWQTALAPTFPWGMGVLIGVCCTAPLVRFFVRLAMKK